LTSCASATLTAGHGRGVLDAEQDCRRHDEDVRDRHLVVALGVHRDRARIRDERERREDDDGERDVQDGG
jgi:hypothetical protein